MTKQTKTLKNNKNECLLVIDFGSQVTPPAPAAGMADSSALDDDIPF